MSRNRLRRRKISPSLMEKNERLAQLLEKLVEKSAQGAIIVVEGVKDAEALRNVGVTGKVFCIKTGRTLLYDVLNDYVNLKEELIILTDFDRRGKQLAGKIVNYLEHHGKPPNLSFWMRMNSLVSGDVKEVEGLTSYLENVKNRCSK